MASSRVLFALCALALFVAVSARSVEEPKLQNKLLEQENRVEESGDVEERNAIIDAIMAFLKEKFSWAAENCLKEVLNSCKKKWYNPKRFLKCAKEYFKEHEGECALPPKKLD